MGDRVLADFCDAIIDCAHKTAPICEDGDYFAVGTPAMRGNVINYAEARRIDRVTFDAWTERLKPRAGDMLLAREAPVGPVVRVPEAENVAPGQRTVLIRPNTDVVDERFLFYYLSSPSCQAALQVRASGSTVPHLNVADVRRLETPGVPKRGVQSAIADVLSAIDDKIAANGRVLGLSRDLARSRYRQASASGARTYRLEDVSAFHNRRRVPLSSNERDERVGSVPYYGAAGRLDSVDEAIFDERIVLVGEDGTVICEDGRPVIQYVWGPAWVNNHAHVLTGTSISTEALRWALDLTNVTHLVTGAVQPKISMANLKSLEIAVPTDTSQMERDIADFAATERGLTEESRVLARTRDELLPLLMSGKVTVKDAEATVAEL